ncbi:MAG: adenosine deaminase [Burkholderiales bacterium]
MAIKPHVLIICAPFGFGPAAKALILAHALRDSAEITLCADRDAYRFIFQYKPSATARVIEGVASNFKDRRNLSSFDMFVNIGHAPALQQLHRLGLSGQTVFVDSLLLWRKDNIQTPVPDGLLGYLAEDHPGTAGLLDHYTATIVALIAPLMWPLADRTLSDVPSIVLHLGGVTSPLVPWETITEPIAKIVTAVARLATRYARSLTIIGSPHLKSLSLPENNVSILGDVSPETSARLIAGAELVVTTPGIGAVYEAMAQDIPVFLLPPMNSTQLHHYQVFTRNGMHGTIPAGLVTRLGESARRVNWEKQTGMCLNALRAHTESLLSELPGLFCALLENPGDADLRNRLMQGQREIFRSFSQTNAIDILKTLLARSYPDARPSRHSVRIGIENPAPGEFSLEQQLLSLPKVELHLHMEGSISPALMLRLAERNKRKLPFTHPDQFYRYCTFGSFRDFANIFLLGVHCLRQPEDFFDVIVDMGGTMARQNIRYAEITWAPQFYLKRGFPLDSILSALNEARRIVKARWGVEMRWIADLLRSYPAPALTVTQWAASVTARAGGVVALGLGGPEAGYLAQGFSSHFQQARSVGLPANPHAGEGMGPSSVWETIEHLRPSRLGHGVRSIEDPALVDYLVRHALPLEVCLTSNIKLGVYASYAEHPVKRLVDAGCRVTLNSDDPVLFQTTLSEEYLHAIRDCGLSLAFVKQSVVDSLKSSYLNEDEKSAMLKEFVAH